MVYSQSISLKCLPRKLNDLTLQGVADLPISSLVEEVIVNGEGKLTSQGAITVKTGKYTGRSPKDKFIVDESEIKDKINWGEINCPIPESTFDKLYDKVLNYLSERKIYKFNGKVCSQEEYTLPIHVITERAWHNLFAKQLFINDNKPIHHNDSLLYPGFTVINAPGFKADPKIDGTNSEVFVIISFRRRIILIGGTEYAGEIKKSVFTVLNCLLPERNVLPMHCSANIGKHGDISLFFGLSGTGKTTLSADENRFLVGDDEHGWHDNGIFNFEGGCYAKCVNLDKEKEPQIYEAINFGTVLENVVIKRENGEPDFFDTSLTENTRAAYPLDNIPGALNSGKAKSPDVIIFLAADAYGVLPPVSKLTKEQAMYHFLSGYTSKLAGTERGVSYPEATFSTCFGAPFMPLDPCVYAKMLGEKIERHNVQVYLVNTGWTGGPYGKGKRIDLEYTRNMITAIQTKEIEKSSFHPDPVFNVLVPENIPGVPSKILTPRNTWENKLEYDDKAKILAQKFQENFKQFTNIPSQVYAAGPNI
ncbi:phosphoenolpyruvate carboxykinase (ATP) [Natranaerobius thermophilus]|uniref:Phosphoenolpyruvate carboxykinase (ATP) n=1 Tax=Natranaerobius thermophilus (strain ATCC BAA-1301 / DSM 18059 / JW/NM-WN-LF) TaxID=457570 RepID=B2A629_NATTJ|nr:phosphoenolpyruvate carboxykinase (ATP) [Natranaerobius thermophilus]ACB85446.1 Phosphoenolpyruvate carboxykinase (ATP) [Natranaerobius thermophilus JW/NM-WN-LF]